MLSLICQCTFWFINLLIKVFIYTERNMETRYILNIFDTIGNIILSRWLRILNELFLLFTLVNYISFIVSKNRAHFFKGIPIFLIFGTHVCTLWSHLNNIFIFIKFNEKLKNWKMYPTLNIHTFISCILII